MGQIQSHTTRRLHDIEISKSGQVKIGRLEISGFFHNFENGVLRPEEPSGPANRRIDHSLISVSVLLRMGSGESTDPQPSKQEAETLKSLVESLKKDQGIRNKQGELIHVDHFQFPEVFAASLKSQWGWIANFQ